MSFEITMCYLPLNGSGNPQFYPPLKARLPIIRSQRHGWLISAELCKLASVSMELCENLVQHCLPLEAVRRDLDPD
jgi:hypothetical protein